MPELEAISVDELLGESLRYTDLIPIDCEAAAAEFSNTQMQRLIERNVAVLRAAAVLEDKRPEHEDSTGLEGEVARMEIKMDLLIDLMGAVMSLQQPPPPEREVTLSQQGIVWEESGASYAADAPHVLSLFLHRCTPQAVQWPVRILRVTGSDQQSLVGARFQGMPEPLLRHVERLIFRRHRRQVAEARKQSEA